MANVDPFRDNPDRSVRFSFDLSLSDGFTPLVHSLTKEVVKFHQLDEPRPSTINQIQAALSYVLANLLNANQISPQCYVAISMRSGDYTKSRYLPNATGYDNLKRVIEYLTKTDPPFARFKRGFYYRTQAEPVGRVSRIRASRRLLELCEEYTQLQLESELTKVDDDGNTNIEESVTELIEQVQGQPSTPAAITGRISLPPTAVTCSPSSDCIRLKDRDGRLIGYDDTPDTRGMRERLIAWNEFIDLHLVDLLLSDAELEAVYEQHAEDDGEEQAFYGDERDAPQYVDLKRTRLHRVFNNGSFDEGGRFYGGWWQRVPSNLRPSIMINGIPTREIDFSNLHAAMLYASKGHPLRAAAYSLEGLDARYRKLIKTTFFKMINAREGQQIRSPNPGELPDGWTWQQLQDAIRDKHAVIGDYLQSGHGLRLQRKDADIAEDVMLTMMNQDILVLPIHDSFITYKGRSKMLIAEMTRAYRDKMESEIGVDVDLAAVEIEIAHLPNDENLEPPTDYDLVDWYERQPGYDGYRQRNQDFFASRTPEWRQRFRE